MCYRETAHCVVLCDRCGLTAPEGASLESIVRAETAVPLVLVELDEKITNTAAYLLGAVESGECVCGCEHTQLAESKARMDAVEADIARRRAASGAIRVNSMQPADVTAAPPEVVAEVLRDPATFLDAAAKAEPGWSDRYGGPEGVAQLTIVLHDHLAELTKRNADLRTSTLIYLRTQANLSLAKLGELLGMSRQRVGVASRRADDGADPTARPFAHLESRDGWNT